MARPLLIAPSILSADHARLAEEIAAVTAVGADWIHVDVMDGHFVPNLTWGPPVIASIRKVTKLPLDVHLMIEEPERSIEKYVKAGADWLTVHVEASVHLHRTLTQIREAGARPGVALNPSTPLSGVVNVLHLVDLVLIMTVNPGFGGQSFIAEMLGKISALRALCEERNLDVNIEVDGGIDPNTIGKVSAAGANAFVAGSAIFGSADYGATITTMRRNASAAPYAPVLGPIDFSLV
ncbi:MAG: ribulose-phosphate 3-epimerase [Deltaproteobacteria bacterium RIFOXYA12_FULL_58_15]|nr:MAG: ribulose-phosphate 3-epimerase [Deltaproteobacteria bacterium RIFOXYA12_FULL_58_15]OGR12140.1 MAG: ribulose-phosphate 3-epimerase [Deltaproteobacteria bacterium RIFOXYB12_FULL_58_9]